MGKAIRASALALLLACSANAGTIQNGVYDPPPPPPPSEGTIQNGSPTAQSTGTMQNGSPEAMSAEETSAESSLLVQIALNLLTLL